MIDKIKIVKTEKNKLGDDWKITKTEISGIALDENTYVGVDPGTANVGLAVITPFSSEIYEINHKRRPTMVERIHNIFALLDYLVSFAYKELLQRDGIRYLNIESVAFGARYRQAELAEIRAAVACWGIPKGYVVEMMPILTIRKRTFGSGKIKASEYWDFLPPNAADALAVALVSRTAST